MERVAPDRVSPSTEHQSNPVSEHPKETAGKTSTRLSTNLPILTAQRQSFFGPFVLSCALLDAS